MLPTSEAGRTKAWLVEYYVRVAPILLPHLEGRPLTMRRFPDGVDGISWHQNECRGEPDWFGVFETRGRGGRLLRFCLAEELPSLVWLSNQGAIELHPFQWRVEAPRRPTALVFDLDPGPPADLVDCARVALRLRDVLADLGLVSYPKASGAVGLHLHVPLGRPHDGERLKAFARTIAETVAQCAPDEIVAQMAKARRAGKVFVDWLQNDPNPARRSPRIRSAGCHGRPPPHRSPGTRSNMPRPRSAPSVNILLFPVRLVGRLIQAIGNVFRGSRA